LASRVGLSSMQMSRIEQKGLVIGLDVLERLAHALNVTPSELLGQRYSLDAGERWTDTAHSHAQAQPRANRALRPGLY